MERGHRWLAMVEDSGNGCSGRCDCYCSCTAAFCGQRKQYERIAVD